MAFRKLDKKHLPAFIFLIDSIVKEDYDIDYQKISDRYGKGKCQVHRRSIQRAFELREKLRSGWPEVNDKPGLSSRCTLNVLTAYYLDNEKRNFLEFAIMNENSIREHYLIHEPEALWIELLFGQNGRQISRQIAEIKLQQYRSQQLKDKGIEVSEFHKVLSENSKAFFDAYLQCYTEKEILPLLERLVEKRISHLNKALGILKKREKFLGLFSFLIPPVKARKFDYENDLNQAIFEYRNGLTHSDGESEFFEDFPISEIFDQT